MAFKLIYLDGLRERDLRPLGVQLGLERRGRQGQRDHLGIHVTKTTEAQKSRRKRMYVKSCQHAPP